MSPHPPPGALVLRRPVVRSVVAAALTALALALLSAVTDAGATARTTRHAVPTAARAKTMRGRPGRCARGAIRLHASYAQYVLCLRDGRLRSGRSPVKGSPVTGTATAPAAASPAPGPAPEPNPAPVAAPVTQLTAAVFGDAPYGTSPSDTSQFNATPAFIDKINADPAVQLVLHAGDIHSGKQYCTASYDRSIADLWATFDDPLVYTPGDNEWADCHKPGEGGGTYNATSGKIDYAVDSGGNPVDYANGDPVANLDLLRRRFFPDAGRSLGVHAVDVTSQARAYDPAHPSDRDYVENVRWEQAGVEFVTVDLPGGSNNDTDPWYGAPAMGSAQQGEVAARTGADLRWLAASFAAAKAAGAKAVLVMWQADVWDLDGKPATHLSQYDQFVDALANETTAFGKPVLMVNGDSHVYRSDNPLAASDPANALHPGHDVANFHRVVVHGSTAPLEYLRMTIDTTKADPTTDTSFGPFRWERIIG